MELLNGPELFQYVYKNRLEEKEVKLLFKDILRAVHFMHSKNIVHRDIKPENIMFTDGPTSDLKLIDFGYSCINNSKKLMDDRYYTLEYAAPEILEGEKYSEACDVWSLGVVLYTMLCGRTPFRREQESFNDATITKRIKNAEIDRKSREWHKVSPDAREVIQSMLEVNPSHRIKLTNIMYKRWLEENINSMDEIVNNRISIDSAGNSENACSKSSSGIGGASDQMNRSESIDSSASTVINGNDNDVTVNGQEDHTNNNNNIIEKLNVTSIINGIQNDWYDQDSDNDMSIDNKEENFNGFAPNKIETHQLVRRLLDMTTLLQYHNPNDILKMLPVETVKPNKSIVKPSNKKRKNFRTSTSTSDSADQDDNWFQPSRKRSAKSRKSIDNITTSRVTRRGKQLNE